ncbi:MAG: hypothetical protein IPJ40_08040 [Saprospirales bacterium]|nr:hypothetical protein [Saprospirales bacterium]
MIHVTRTAATADYLNQYRFTTNTLSSMTVDFAGTGAQTINSTVGTYGALTTSGSGTKTLQEGRVEPSLPAETAFNNPYARKVIAERLGALTALKGSNNPGLYLRIVVPFAQPLRNPSTVLECGASHAGIVQVQGRGCGDNISCW